MVLNNQNGLRKHLGNDQGTGQASRRGRGTSQGFEEPLRPTQVGNSEKIRESMEPRKRKLRRTDSWCDYVGSSSTSATIMIESDGEEELRLQREISDLYQQIKLKKERIEKIRINKAVSEALRNQRRETKRWLPTLAEVEKTKDSIIKNLSGDSSDSDSEDLGDLPTVDEIFDEIINKNKNNLNDVD